MIKTFKFLVSDGMGAASRGWDIDHYRTYTIKAETEKEAYNKVVAKMFGYKSIKEMILEDEYSGYSLRQLCKEEREEAKAAIAAFDGKAYLKSLDITGGDPWIEGLKVDGKTVIRPDWENMSCYGYQFTDKSYKLWGVGATADDEF